MIGDTANEQIARGLRYQRAGGPRVGRVPIVESDLARWEQDQIEGEISIWEHDGFRFRVLGLERYRGSDGVYLLVVAPEDGGPHG